MKCQKIDLLKLTICRRQNCRVHSKARKNLKMKINWSGRSHKYSQEDVNYLVDIIKNADPLTQGKYLKKFEERFAKYINKKCICNELCSSCFRNNCYFVKIRKGDEIIVPAHTYCASAIPFARNGAKLKMG